MRSLPVTPARCALWLAAALAGCAAPPSAGAPSLRAESREREPLEHLLWRAGRPAPAGLSAAREREIEEERSRARALLASELGRSGEARLASWLDADDTPDELWGAAARTAAALERYGLAPRLGAALADLERPRRAAAAREALHALYGRWFQSPAELEPYLAGVKAGPGTRLLLENLRWEEGRSRERLLAQLAHEPGSAAAWLADPDPRVRSGAARALAQVFQREDGDPAGTLEVLVAHLEGELEPRAFHEGLLACLERLERGGGTPAAATRLRALLLEIARSGDDPRALSVAQAIARLAWRTSGPRDLEHVLTGVDMLGSLLGGLATADERRGVNDPDPHVAVLAALRQLCAQAGAGGLARELRASAVRARLLATSADPGQDEGVRAAAAAALGPFVGAEDGAELAAVLADPRVGAGVKHALLGTLREVLREVAPPTRGADALLAAVAALCADADADLRRKALELLAEPRLEPRVRALDPSFLVACLAREEGRAATLQLLTLLQRFGRPEMLDALLALPRFGALCAEPATLEALAPLLLGLCAGAGQPTLRAAERLAEAGSLETQLAGLRHALALVAALDDSAAFALAPEEHGAVLAWVWRAVGAGLAPRELAPAGLAFEQRLLDVHLARTDGASLGAGERAHLAALLRADLFLAGGPAGGAARGSKQDVEAAFEAAHELAPATERRLLVLRDRARFRAAANECVKAMSDYRRLLEAPVGEGLLGIPDLRSAVELLGRMDEGAKGRSATAAEASELLRRIVARRGWRSEPAAVRMQDLRDWTRTALEGGESDGLRPLAEALADLPLTQAESQLEREPAPLWLGLTREAAWFQELLDLRTRVRLALRALEAQG